MGLLLHAEALRRTPEIPAIEDSREDWSAIKAGIDADVAAIAMCRDPDWWLSYFLEHIEGSMGEPALRAITDMIIARLRNGGW